MITTTASDPRLSVTLVMPSASPTGGAEEAFCQLLKSNAARSMRWQLIFLENGPLVAQVEPFVARSLVVQCGRTREFWKWWKASTMIAAFAKEFQSDLILGWMTKGHVYGGLAARRAHIRAAWFQMGLPEDGLLDKVSRRLPAEAVFTCSEFVAGLQRAKQPSANVVPVPLGVDVSRFDHRKLPTPMLARQQLGLPSSGPIVGIVGRLQRWKGMHTLIAAMPTVLQSHPDAHCVIVGGAYSAEPDYESRLREQVADLGVDAFVTFAGAQTNIPLWMQAMDVIVHASEREPFGIVIVEALALGKPVIACSPGGPEQILRDLPSCLLVPFENSQALSQAVIQTRTRLADDTAERIARGRQFSASMYSERLVIELEKISTSAI